MIGASLEIASRVPGNMFEVARVTELKDTIAGSIFRSYSSVKPRASVSRDLPSRLMAVMRVSASLLPKGELLAEQLQTHVTEKEDRMGLVCGNDLATINIRGHKLGIAMGTDAWYPEVGRILALLGVDTILAPTGAGAIHGMAPDARPVASCAAESSFRS